MDPVAENMIIMFVIAAASVGFFSFVGFKLFSAARKLKHLKLTNPESYAALAAAQKTTDDGSRYEIGSSEYWIWN